MRVGDRVRVILGRHRGEEGTVLLPIRSGVEVQLDEAGWAYLFQDDLEVMVTL